jgi:hypothetical protein
MRFSLYFLTCLNLEMLSICVGYLAYMIKIVQIDNNEMNNQLFILG